MSACSDSISKGVSPSSYSSSAMSTPDNVFYKQLYQFRIDQQRLGERLHDLTSIQWGLVELDRCHHISTASSNKDVPTSYRVRICKTCCQESGHIELGTYVDQESAILVNDAFEIINNRTDKLIVLRKEDKPFLHMLRAKKFDRSKGTDYVCVLDLISEKLQTSNGSHDGRKRKPSQRAQPMEITIACNAVRSSKYERRNAAHGHVVANEADKNQFDAISAFTVPINRPRCQSPQDQLSSAYVSDDSDEYRQGFFINAVKKSRAENQSDSNINQSIGSKPFSETILLGQYLRQEDDDEMYNDVGYAYQLNPGRCHMEEDSNDISEDHNGRDPYAIWVHQQTNHVIAAEMDLSYTSSEGRSSSPTMRDENIDGMDSSRSGMTTRLGAKRDKELPDDFGASSSTSYARLRSYTFSSMTDFTFRHGSLQRWSSSESLAESKFSGTGSEEPVKARETDASSAIEALTWLATMRKDEMDVAKSLFELGHTNSQDEEVASKENVNSTDPLLMLSASANKLLNSSNRSSWSQINGKVHHEESLIAKGLKGRGEIQKSGSSSDMLRMVSNLGKRGRSNSMSVIECPMGSASAFSTGDVSTWPPGIKEGDGFVGSRAGYIGIYSPEERKLRIQRFIQKRKQRMWAKKVKYDVRKNFADSRIRIKGRFVKKEEELHALQSSHSATMSHNHYPQSQFSQHNMSGSMTRNSRGHQ